MTGVISVLLVERSQILIAKFVERLTKNRISRHLGGAVMFF